MKSKFSTVLLLPLVALLPPLALGAQATKARIPFADAKPIFDALRADLVPSDLRDRTPAEREAFWPEWIMRRDAAIRARVAGGDDDAIVHLLLFGTAFTKQPPITEQEIAGIVVQTSGTPKSVFVASPVLKARLDDFLTAVVSPSRDERLQFAAQVLERNGVNPIGTAGRERARRYLEERISVVGQAERTARLLDPGTDLTDRLTIFRDRGLSSDSSIPIDFGIEQALDAMKAAGAVRSGTVMRVALIGPGLDFVDKQNGYDFYPPQAVQPFALVDSLLRLELADAAALRVTALDLSPRVLQHLERARERARAGDAYAVVLPRGLARPWSSELADYWERFGNWIGQPATTVPTPPASAGRVEVRGVSIRPEVVLSVTPADLNIVTERLDPSSSPPFDLIVATNILLYYDVFEQSLAAANIAAMLRPGGFLLTNNRIFELPESPLSGVGYTDVVYYMSLPGIGEAGDRMIWYQKQ